MKKIFLVTSIATGIILELSSFNVYATESEIVGIYNDANNDYYAEAIGAGLKTPNILKNTIRAGINPNSGLLDMYPDPFDTFVTPVEVMYFEENDCQGDGFLETNWFDIEPKDGGSVLISNIENINKNVWKYDYDAPRYRSFSYMKSIARIGTDGKLSACNPYSSSDDSAFMARTNNKPINIKKDEKYSWIRFEYVGDWVRGFADAILPLTFINKNGPVVNEVKRSISLNISADGKLSSATIIKGGGSQLYYNEIKVERVDQGIYSVTLPNRFLPSEGGKNDIQLTCSSNKPSIDNGGKMGISCYKLDNQSIIRVVSDWKANYPSDTKFSLNVSW
ncbi:hypothetical protein [Photobacterium kishitanii]|uniref:hypothetical protein n=1 Tax=Photobacterium kishitanii TaxID=318456 RepID=UPI0007F8DC77|nr:hypothetical protein [Photobacterium kishitanii]OBU32847.1 hypothetical protein AYY23_16935 [Photobacterium kishitanii]PSU21029.1 hypothetical protein CTM84_10815 [Photobacterium kishitanii]PSV16897.1 hypothetical protein C0W59_06625 [Photobacterium kishitanii]PSW51556.1 hypothetical protein C0W66_01695 [Photobacterium kishitanii]